MNIQEEYDPIPVFLNLDHSQITGPCKSKKTISPWSSELNDSGDKSLGVWSSKTVIANPSDSGECFTRRISVYFGVL